METHEKRREAFLDIAASDPQRCHVIDALHAPEEIAARILAIVSQRLASHDGQAGPGPETAQ